MTEQYYPQDVLFGFEYETLIQPEEKFWDLALLTVKNIISEAINICADTFKEVRNISENQSDKLIRSNFTEYKDPMEYTDKPDFNNVTSPNSSEEGMADVVKLQDDTVRHIVYRFLLAAIFNNIIRNKENLQKYNFKAQGENGDICDTFIINNLENPIITKPNPKIKSDKNWAVTYDMSVQRVANEKLYKRIEGRTIRKPIAYIRHVEIVSPILKYSDVVDDFKDIINNVLPANKMLTYWNNHLTSNHVHISHPGFNFRENPMGLVKLCMAWWYIEPIIFLMMGYWRRQNIYCTPMNDILKKTFNDSSTLNLKGAFLNINESTIFNHIVENMYFKNINDKLVRKYSKSDFTSGDNLKILYAIADLFQGDLSNRSSRYAALNLLNLHPDGINTVEIRVKHGSADGEESKMFMLLLANFLSAVIRKPCITNADKADKELFFEIKNILQSHKDWTNMVRLDLGLALDSNGKLGDKDKIINNIQRAFKIFMKWIDLDEKNEVRNYWNKRLDYVIKNKQATPSTSGISSKLRSPILGGMKPKDSNFTNHMNQKREYTSFGYVNYDDLYESIKNDYKRFGWTERWASTKKSAKSSSKTALKVKLPMTTPMVMATAGGKGKKAKKEKKEKP